MLSSTLSRFVQEKSGEIVQRWSEKVMEHAATASFINANMAEVERDAYEVLREFEYWMSSQVTRADIGRWYAQQGVFFFRLGIPMCEVYRAFILLKNIIVKFVSTESVTFDTAIQINMLHEFNKKLEFFFEQAMYYMIRGYTEAMNEKMKESFNVTDDDTDQIFFGSSFYRGKLKLQEGDE